MAKTGDPDVSYGAETASLGRFELRVVPLAHISPATESTPEEVPTGKMKLVEFGKTLQASITKVDSDNRLVFGWFNVPFPARFEKFFAPEGSAEELLERIAHAFRHQFPSSDHIDGGNDHISRWIVATYPNEGWVIASAHTDDGTTYFRHDFVTSGDTFIFGEGAELEVVYVEKELGLDLAQLPKVDLQGDIVPIEELENAAYTFVLKSRQGGAVHEEIVGDLVESFMATEEKYLAMGIPSEVIDTLNKGWWGGFYVEDDDAWSKVQSEEYGMFSIGGASMATDVS